jgi:DNA polymerase type B, organellar and viral
VSIKDPVMRKIADKESRPFVGVDGEGGNVPEPGALFGDSHEYLLLRAGDQVLETGDPLGWEECLSFLAGLHPAFTYVSYYFDYDVTMMLRRAPEPALRQLLAKGGFMQSARIGNYDVSYTPHKEFKVRHRREGAKWVTISDMGPFFQCSFVKALTDWNIGTPEQRERIAADKARRSEFGAMTALEREYNREEVELFEQLAQEFAEACYTVGYIPARWQGPGWLATAVMRAHDVARSKDLPITSNKLLMKLANEAYYGGRFEITCVGPVPGPVFEYDINSAYPHAMASVLPCLRHGTWIKQAGRPDAGTLGFGQVSFDHEEGVNLCHLPIRTKEGGLTFPRQASGVYWSLELDAAERAGTRVISTGTWYVYQNGKTCTCEPFAFVPELYAQRKRIGKNGRGRILKLALNSLYGKMAQSIGMPAYSNPIYASLITANTRAMIIDAYRTDPGSVVAIATDAVYSRTPLELDCGDGLGQWDRTVLDDGMFNVMPGMYYSGGRAGATRGVPLPSFQDAERDFKAAFEDLKNGKPRTVRIDGTGFITIRQALAWNKPHLAGSWLPNPKDISFDWKSKRDPGFAILRNGTLWTRPQPGHEGLVSVPYNRSIGGWADKREWSREQPDYSSWFLPG